MSLGSHASRHRDAAAQPLADAPQTRERAAGCYSTGCLVAVAPIAVGAPDSCFLAASERDFERANTQGA